MRNIGTPRLSSENLVYLLMTKKIKLIVIPVQIYKVSVIIFFGASLDEVVKVGVKKGIEPSKFTKQWKGWVEAEMKKGQGFCLDYGEGNKDVLVWMWKRPEKLKEYATLYHELYHATDHIADSRNFDPVDKMSEPKAYLFEFLFKEVSQKLWV